MKADKGRIGAVTRLVTANIVKEIAKNAGITEEDAYRRFSKSKTYALLQDEKAKLYTESLEYIRDMLSNEVKGNWTEWRKV